MKWAALRTLGERLKVGRREEIGHEEGRRRWTGGAGRPRRPGHRPGCEALEDRRLLATPGYDYVLSGYAWQNPSRITYSIAPDGVFWDHGTNNLQASFGSRLGTANWQRAIARAFATWQAVADINLALVGDGAYDFNTLGVAQGDSRFGDIRLGGYVFPNNNTTLAQSYFPPPNGSTAAGDLEINTSLDFNIGSAYDLYSVVLHELGHSLGLEHAPSPSVIMAPNYGGVRTGLTEGDIAGIRAIYGPRSLDVYQRNGRGLATSPIDVSAALSTGKQGTTSDLSLTSIGSSEYFTFQAPGDASGRFTVTAAASGISMLSPMVSVYDEAGGLISQASNASSWSTNVTATVEGVIPGRRYSIVVTGATSDVFSVGAYALVVGLPDRTVTPPAPVNPGTSTPPPGPTQPLSIPADRFESNDTIASSSWIGRVTQLSVGALSFSSASDVDYFALQTGQKGPLRVTAAGAVVQIYNARGKLVARGVGQASASSARAGTLFYVRTSAPGSEGVAGYSLSISAGSSPLMGRRARPIYPWFRR